MDAFAVAAGLATVGAGWIGIGFAVAAVFLIVGLDRVDPAARHAYGFRPLLAPGIALLWPVVLWRWIALERRR